MTITVEFLGNSQTLSGKPTEMWEVTGAKDYTEVLSAIPGDFKVYLTTVTLLDSCLVEIVRHF